METPSTLCSKKKRISLANKPGSKGDAGSNNKPLTKLVTETTCSPPEVQQQEEEMTQAEITIPPADNPPAHNPPSTATSDVLPPTEAPRNPTNDAVLTATSARKRHRSSSSRSSSPSSSSSSSSSLSSSSSSSKDSNHFSHDNLFQNQRPAV